MKTFLITCFIFLVTTTVNASTEIPSEIKLDACASCHGQNGNGILPAFPKVAGQNKRYFTKQMMDYKTGNRINPVMQAILINLTDEDIHSFAHYYSQQKPIKTYKKPDLVSLGQMIYVYGIVDKGIPACSACHDPKGLGNAQAGFPRLSGQYAEYTAQQLKEFRLGHRHNDIHRMMEMISSKMNDDEINAVASYIERLN